MVSKFLLAASHLALVASAIIEGAAGGAGSSRRQFRVPRAQQPASLLAHTAPPPPSLVKTQAADVAQLAFAVSGKGGPEEVEELEKMVTDLVKKGKMATTKDKDAKATPMEPAVQSVKNIIDTVMLPNRQAAHQRDQDALNADVAGLRECVKSMGRDLRMASNSKSEYRDASSQHNTCRHTEAGEWIEQNDYCRPSALEVKRLQAQATCAEVEAAQRFIHCNYQRITDAELACEKANRQVSAAQELCDTTKSRYEARKSNCDQLQSFMDNAACKHAVRMKEACGNADSCYNSKFETYQATYRKVQNQEEARKGEWRALKRMQCLMGTFENGKVTDSEVDECKEKTHTPPSITYPSVPSIDACSVPDTYPGRAAYKKAEFAGLPPQAKGSPEAGNCYAMGF